MRAFEYTRVDTIDQAITLLDHAPDHLGQAGTRALAGGTDLLTLIKAEVSTPIHLVDIKRLSELPRGIVATENGLSIGALTTLSEIEKSQLLRSQYPILAEAAAVAATPQLRNMATIGGNLLQRPRCWYFRNQHFACWLKGGEGCPAQAGENQQHALFSNGACYAVHPSDLAAALVALAATVRLRGAQGERTLPLHEFFALPEDHRRRETTIADDELLLSIDLPSLPADTHSTYLKAMDRKVWAFALVGVAAVLQVTDGQVTAARIVLSGVAPIPWRVRAAEQTLIGASLPDAALLERVATIALAEAMPLAQNQYKVPLAKQLIQRALSTLSA